MPKSATQKTTVNQQEVEQFQHLAETWWDEKGPFKPLHKFNPCRLGYIRETAIRHFGLDDKAISPLKGLKVLDIGCGGGLLSEPMARMGANVTGIDAGEKNVNIARSHARQSELDIDYQCITVEELATKRTKYDIILNMEVVEHVEDVPLFLESSAKLLKKDGLMFVATLNRTAKSYALAIVGAEYIMRWLPVGTHDWNKFLKPSEIAKTLEKSPVELIDTTGCTYNPLTASWSRTNDMSVNYMLTFKKS